MKRRSLIEADLVGCMAALLGQLLYSTQTPVCVVPEFGIPAH